VVRYQAALRSVGQRKKERHHRWRNNRKYIQSHGENQATDFDGLHPC
jgi:two-component sensor histidine kinase